MATWDTQDKPGSQGNGWQYDESNLEYDTLEDSDSGNAVYYDSIGISQTWTNQSKS